jgi:GT2 family glycosyltransferase
VETDAPLAPPVVAVVVVHAPDAQRAQHAQHAWFDETLASIAAQDYPNLDTLFLLTGSTAEDDLAARITAQLPDAFVRDLGANPGFGAAANEVLRLVEGDSGFFLFCHDDVALAPDAVRMLVEELYRSNAGVVGPKLVSWDDPAVLQHVGLGLDRFGEVDPITEPGEYDQEQHDAVRDVFTLPSACLLVRADLFRALGGFDSAINFHGDDIELCWRIHLSGARVVVAPQARVRHREELEVRRPDLDHDVLRARHRMRTVATLTSGSRLPVRSLEMMVLTVAELAVGLFTGRLGEAWASLRALVGLIPRTPALLARRGTVSKLRQVTDNEILRLQNRGSARLTSYRRARDTETYVGIDRNVRRWRPRSLGPVIAWILVVVGILAASRTMFDTRVPSVGEFLPLPDSPRHLWNDFTTAWSPAGLGSTTANPTGWAAVVLASPLWLARSGLGLTVIVVGLVLIGVAGAWKLATVFPTNRARVTALAVYAAVPLTPGVISTGRLTALVAYAAVPWFVHLLRTAVGIGTADPAATSDALVDGVFALSVRERIRRTVVLAIVTAVAVGMAPAVLPVVALIAVLLGLATVIAAGWRSAAWMAGLGLAACAGALVLNLPWSLTWSWDDLVSPTLAGAPGRGLIDVASMAIGQARLEVLALALYAPVVIALAVARAWRFTWAVRAALLVTVFGALAVLQDRDALPVRVPDVGVLLVPVALGLALSAAAAVASFGRDVAGRTFGWRQPAGVLSLAAVAIGIFPAVLTLTDGAWFAPRTTLVDVAEAQLPVDPEIGDYRVLYVGDPRVLPVPVDDLGGGVSMAVVDDGDLDLRDRWPAPHQDADDRLAAAIDEIRSSSTLRGGRLLAPFGVRFVVVPFVDGANSTASDPLPVPEGLLDAFDSQLDIVRRYSPPNLAVYENRAAIPTTARLEGDLAEASRVDSPDQLVGVDTSGAEPALLGADGSRRADGTAAPGVLHLGVPLDDSWELSVNGEPVAGRVGFGVTTAYDVAAAGTAELRYQSPASRTTWLIVLALLWVAALVAASRVRLRTRLARWRPARPAGETLIDFDTSVDQPRVAQPTDVTGLADLEASAPSADWVDAWLAEEEPQTVGEHEGRANQ